MDVALPFLEDAKIEPDPAEDANASVTNKP